MVGTETAVKLATIDIGTHSVLLLITAKKDDDLVPLVDEATLTRIGEGMGKANAFSVGGMARTLAVLKKYKKICEEHAVEKILAVGTAAFRKAKNAKGFVEQVEKECRIRINIICGEREAELTWKAASTDFGSDIIVVDIGGGSTEVMSSPEQCISLPIGSVILTERFCHSDPISEQDYQHLVQAIEERVKSANIRTPAHPHTRTLVATAGTATTLGAIKLKLKIYQHNQVHGMTLSMSELKNIIADFKSRTIEERKKIPGLEPGRADVILAGSLLLQKIAEHFGFQEITVSDRGVRWGLAYEAFQTP